MAEVYNLIYQGDFCNDAGDDIFVEFSKRMDSGDPVPDPIDIVFASNNPITATYKDEGPDKLNPIYGTACEIKIMAVGDFELSEMYAEDERMWRIRIYGASTFEGWVLPQGCSEPYGSKPYPVSIGCTDALGTLKKVPFLKDDSTRYTGYESDRTLVHDILAKTGLSLPIGHAVNTFEATMETTFSPLAQTFPNTAAFLDVDGNPLSCYDVLTSIIQRWSCSLRQVDGMWQMTNILEKSRGVVNMWVYNADNTLGTARNIGNSVIAGGDNRVFSPSEHQTWLEPGYKSTMAYYKYGYPSNDLLNPDFNDATPPALPNHWVSQAGATGSSASVLDPDTGLPTPNYYLIISSAPGPGSFIVNDTPIAVLRGEQVDVSFIWRCDEPTGVYYAENRWLRIALQIRTGDGWHFTKENGWVNYGAAYVVKYRARDVFRVDVTISFSIPPRDVDYTLDIGLRLLTSENSAAQFETKFDNVKLAPTTDVKQTKPPVGVFNRQTSTSKLTQVPEPILLLHSDDPNQIRNSRISITLPPPVQTPTTWTRWDIFEEDQSLLHIVANSQLRLHQRTYRIFEAIFTRNDPFDTTVIDANTLVTFDLLPGTFLMLSGQFNFKSGNHKIMLAEVLIDEPSYYYEVKEDYGTEKSGDGISIGSPSGVTPPPLSGGGGNPNTQYIQPEIIPFDWDVTHVTSIDMTINGRNLYGKYPNVEIWNTIDDDNEVLYPGQYQVNRVLDAGVLQSIEFPDLTMFGAVSQQGYFKLSK